MGPEDQADEAGEHPPATGDEPEAAPRVRPTAPPGRRQTLRELFQVDPPPPGRADGDGPGGTD